MIDELATSISNIWSLTGVTSFELGFTVNSILVEAAPLMFSTLNSLKEFIESETIRVKSKLQSLLPKVNDKVTKIKLNEAVNQAETLMKGRIVEDKQVVTLMRYYQLVKELENVKNG